MNKPVLKIENLKHSYGDTRVLNGVSLELKRASIACLLGPSGSGKSTLLRCIAGFEPVEEGRISINGHVVSEKGKTVAPEKRKIGVVFQDFALFPHMTVEQNICFGLKNLSVQPDRLHELVDALELNNLLERFPHELSGGQQQRVALARALAPKPDILLLDEPFSNLDPRLREKTKREVRRVLKHFEMTTVIVTHDQYEAFDTADEIGLMENGKLLQWDTSYNLYHKPASRDVARFIGEGVFVPVFEVHDRKVQTELGCVTIPEEDWENSQVLAASGKTLEIFVRPDDVVHDDESPKTAKVVERYFRGTFNLFILEFPSGIKVPCMAPSHHNHDIGTMIGVHLELDHVLLFPVTAEPIA